ncbi:hypothetical protein GCM10022252_09590 [Streptosporangium oxazolinicum]|uniref:Uncharacterized protein n=1 Tax=Streptosporangium oxazolinicum TaxID=909287 RepID=A0ABP8AF44_9ACTN
MFGTLVSVHLFRVEHALRLRRIPPPPATPAPPGSSAPSRITVPSRTSATRGTAASRRSDPAILVIPREGPLRAPHLMILSPAGHHRGLPPGRRVFDGTHIVATLDDPLGRIWCEVADVLVSQETSWNVPERDISGLLDRYPGCEVAVGGHEAGGGFLAGLRDGRLAAITEVGGLPGGSAPWPAVYGSFLYGWRIAGMPFESLATASVIVGRYADSSAARIGTLEVAGRTQVRPAHLRTYDTGGMSA